MTLRERIADWISGGALSRARHEASMTRIRGRLDAAIRDHALLRSASLETGLMKVAACETEKANATVRRMAKIAREAMD